MILFLWTYLPRSRDHHGYRHERTQLLCDALVVRIAPQRHWLGVYQGDPEDPTCLQCLDRVALSELSNPTCWFYPTHEGTVLGWERPAPRPSAGLDRRLS